MSQTFHHKGRRVDFDLWALPDMDLTLDFGMIHAYAESRNRPMQTDPNIVDVPTGGLYGEMFDVGDDSNQITTNAQNKNDNLPYLNDMDTQSIEFYAPAANIVVSRLPHSWVCVNAWTKAMEMWRQQQNDRLEESGLMQTIAAHRDFKIYVDADHAAQLGISILSEDMIATGMFRS